MICKKLIIETDGTTKNTKIFVDNKCLSNIQRINFSADCNDLFVNLSLEAALLDLEGKIKVKKSKIRDERTQELIDYDKVIKEPISLEFMK